LRSPFYCARADGFTLPELIAVIAIASIIAAIGLPRMWASGYDDRRLYDETLAALRYAHRTAVAYQRTVCANFTGTSLTLTYSSAYAPPSCNTPLREPNGTSQYLVNAVGSAAYLSAFNFSFDRRGVPSAAQTLSITDGKSIVIEPDSGYVH
jgi:MSHA pilin protein MshC